MKKFIYVLVVGVVTAFLCMGCGSDKEGTAKAENTEQQTTEEATAIPEETLAPTPEATEEPREEVTIENEKTEATPEPTEEPVPQYTYTDMAATMYAQQTVNIRDLPDTNGNKIGSLSTNDEITVSGQCNETSWYRFEYNGNVAYVSNKYVGENKVEVQQQATANNGSEQAQAPSTPASNSGDWKTLYSAGTWYDMGEFVFIIEYGNDWTMQHNWSDWEGKYPYVDFSGQAKTDDARIFFAYSNPDSKELSNFLRQYTH